MARYIDADKLKAKIQKSIEDYYFAESGGYYLAEDAVEEIDLADTADVVPKSEVAAMQKRYGEKLEVAEALIATLNKSKAEVAREIFEEIEKIACVYKLDGDFYLDNGLYAELKKKHIGE